MKVALQAILPLVLIYFIITYFKGRSSEVKFVKSTIDGNMYLVRDVKETGDNSSLEAANLLALIRRKMVEFIDQLEDKYPERVEVKRLVDNFQPENISEGSNNTGYTTYTVSKGEKMVFCLRDRNGTNKLHDLNTLIFVALHELAHIATKEYNGHDEVFKRNFKFLIDEAMTLGIYKFENYKENPKSYCGIVISDTPAGK